MNEAQLLALAIRQVPGGWSYLETDGQVCADVYPTKDEAIFAFGIYSYRVPYRKQMDSVFGWSVWALLAACAIHDLFMG